MPKKKKKSCPFLSLINLEIYYIKQIVHDKEKKIKIPTMQTSKSIKTISEQIKHYFS